jgi:hypothetical protein
VKAVVGDVNKRSTIAKVVVEGLKFERGSMGSSNFFQWPPDDQSDPGQASTVSAVIMEGPSCLPLARHPLSGLGVVTEHAAKVATAGSATSTLKGACHLHASK